MDRKSHCIAINNNPMSTIKVTPKRKEMEQAEKTLSTQVVDEWGQELLTELFDDEWRPNVRVEGLPVSITEDALAILLDDAKNNLLAAVRKACGMSLAQGRENITKGDAELAIRISKEGFDALLKTDEW